MTTSDYLDNPRIIWLPETENGDESCIYRRCVRDDQHTETQQEDQS